ncbi:hypothetical protein [Embleya sp. NPDC020630]|uniref:hypothetical protein n=1 Tax=Embleya sp. NPDC020630 TaxID=3363979 RepID=UPI00378ED866
MRERSGVPGGIGRGLGSACGVAAWAPVWDVVVRTAARALSGAVVDGLTVVRARVAVCEWSGMPGPVAW